MTHIFLRAEFLEAVEASNAHCTELHEPERGALRTQLISRFAERDGYPLHDHLRNPASLQSDVAWQLLGELFPAIGPVWVFFEEEDDPSFFVLESSSHLVELVGNTTGFTIYLADIGLSSLVALASFDVLVAAGHAAKYVAGWPHLSTAPE